MMIDGHGHVRPRSDGVKARCGGPPICPVCALELAQKSAEEQMAKKDMPIKESEVVVMFTQVGSCLKCGAPIYVPSVWMGVVPPPPQYTCGCRGETHRTYTSTDTAPVVDPHN